MKLMMTLAVGSVSSHFRIAGLSLQTQAQTVLLPAIKNPEDLRD